MLNKLWLTCFLAAASAAFMRWFGGGEPQVFAAIVTALFDMAKLAVDIMILLFGTLTLWLGFLNIAEQSGLVQAIAKRLGPLFTRLMPEVPAGHPAIGLITLNFAANTLGLDNAATPIGLRAMHALQSLNPQPNTATNAQILFMVLNTSSLTLLPVTLFMYRLQQGASDPALVFLPVLLATSTSTLVALFAVAFCQRLSLRDPVVLAWLGAVVLGLAGITTILVHLTATALTAMSSILGNVFLFSIIIVFLIVGAWRKLPVYESFIAGAKQGFEITRDLLPYLLAMLCAVGVLRASGALDFILDGVRWLAQANDWDTRFVDALPTALVRPFSGSAARAMMLETMARFGVDSFPALLATTMQGSTDTTFYVLAIYCGAVGIQRTRHAVGCALLADFAGLLAAIGVCYWFFG